MIGVSVLDVDDHGLVLDRLEEQARAALDADAIEAFVLGVYRDAGDR